MEKSAGGTFQSWILQPTQVKPSILYLLALAAGPVCEPMQGLKQPLTLFKFKIGLKYRVRDEGEKHSCYHLSINIPESNLATFL